MILKALKALRRSRVADTPVAGASQALSPTEIAELLEPVRRALDAGQTAEAEALVQTIVRERHDLAEAHLLQGNLLHRRRDYEGARDSYTLAECFRPGAWEVHFHFGLLELDESRPHEAIRCLERALELGARDARVHNALGAAYTHAERVKDAAVQFTAALELDAGLAAAHNNLGYILYHDLDEPEAGAEHVETARRLAPDDVAVLCTWIMVLHNTGRIDEALEACEKVIERDDSVPEPRVTRALILLSRGEWAPAWPEYEARKQLPRYHCPRDLPWREWDGSDLAGKTIYVHSEQGLGDEIMFASCLPDLIGRAGTCVVECHPKLERLYRRSFPRASVVVGRDAWRAVQAPVDYQVAVGSLPRFFRREAGDFPRHRGYLHAEPSRVEAWRERLAQLPGRVKVGISWQGGLPSTRRRLRSIALRDWAPLLTLPGVDFVSLQYSDCTDELAQVRDTLGATVHQWPEAIGDYDETAALVSALDLVVSVQTALVHLAGALGQRTWALISALPEWRYGVSGEGLPWYPSVRLIRQETPDDWAGVLRRVRAELALM